MISITLVLKSLHHCINRKMEKISKKYGVSGVQFVVLVYLLKNENIDVFQKDIERLIDVRRSTATVILQNLTQKGFITRENSEKDGRLKKIALTEKAKGMVKEFEQEMIKLQDIVESDISLEEKENFVKVSEKIKDNLENIDKN